MTINDFHVYVSVLNDRFSAYWSFSALTLEKDQWIELLIQFIESDQ